MFSSAIHNYTSPTATSSPHSTSAARSPSKCQLYRVHKPFLSHNFPLFANLFADAAPGDLYDDVPAVEMIGDMAVALASLLTFIYKLSDIKIRRWDPDTPIAVVPEPASTTRFELELGCPKILLTAFYQLSPTDVTHDCTDLVSCSSNWQTPARWSLLETPDLLRHPHGGKKLLQHVASAPGDETLIDVLCYPCLPWWEDAGVPADVWWEIEDERNEEAYPCYTLLRRIFEAAFRERSPGVRDPLKALKECLDYEKIPGIARASSFKKSLCTTCDSNFREWVPEVRQELWQKLPEYFEVSLPPPR